MDEPEKTSNSISRPLTPSQRNIDGSSYNRPLDMVEIQQHPSHQPLISQEFFTKMLETSGGPLKKSKLRLPRFPKFQFALLSVALIFLIGGAYLSAVSWHSSNNLKGQAAGLTGLDSSTGKSTADISSGSKASAPSTTPVTSSMLADYAVAPSLPRYLIIPKIGVDARVMSVGLTSSGAIGTPGNINDTAWYNESSEPGQPGAMVIDGHVSSWTADGVFYSLKNLQPGDNVEIERGSGTMFTYKVVKSQVFPAGNVNMAEVMAPVISNQPGLNLVTCAGDVIAGTNEFSERLVVFTTEVSS